MATIDAKRPTTRPVASIITHFFWISAGLAENVFMTVTFMGLQGAWLCRLIHQGATRGQRPTHKSRSPSAACIDGLIAPMSGMMGTRRDGIGGGHMRHRLLLVCAADGSLPGREALAELEEARLGGQVPRRWFAQEIDIEIDGDRKRHRS